MEFNLLTLFTCILLANECTRKIDGLNCGCKTLRPCYKRMIDSIKDHDETACVEEASIGASTITVFLTAIHRFCGNFTEIIVEKDTYEGRHLYEVILRTPKTDDKEDDRPVIVIESGQEAGTESVGLALYVIEQLISCQENNEMIQKVRWVILPCTNPDGMEYARYNRIQWNKNVRPIEDNLSYGVDISRNFEGDWKICPPAPSGFSQIYPGAAPASENETIFIQSVLTKYRKEIKAYLSLRKDGHSIGYPYGHDSAGPPAMPQLEKVAAAITARVNQRAASVHLFMNRSIYELNGKPRCGHSVDYAHQFINVLYSYEMRVFLGSENKMISKFHTLPRGYEGALRNGYYSGIKELYNVVVKEKSSRHY